jgi:hypothetical protein
MERYLIETQHTAEDCNQVLQDIYAAGFLHHFEWGCKDGEHCGVAIIEAVNHDHARQIVPWYLREKTRVVHLVKFDLANESHAQKE